MSLSVGIVGLPNVGKSTLFNALTRAQNAEAANYPFCTIEPNKASVPVPDVRLDELAKIAKPGRIVKATVDFTDIAGLVRGASRGEGLGNKFLANIREADAILHVVRCFRDDDVVHVEGGIDPVRDIGIIETELVLADIETVTRQADEIGRKAHSDPKQRPAHEALKALLAHLDEGNPVHSFQRGEDSPLNAILARVPLLTDKPTIYVANVGEEDLGEEENEHVKAVKEFAKSKGSDVIVISAQVEADLAGLDDAERAEFLASYGLKESGLDRTARTAYHTLGLASYFTAGPMEVKAWTFRRGWTAPRCAGVIHTDFERGFIRAEVVSYQDYIDNGGEQGAREKGLLRVEGKEYAVQDGDVIHFLI